MSSTLGLASAVAGGLVSAIAGGLASTVTGGFVSAEAGGLVSAGGLSFAGGEVTSRTKLFLGCFDFCLVVADFLGGGNEAAELVLFLDFVFAMFIEFSSLSPCFVSSTFIDFSSPIATTVALYNLLSDHLTVHVDEIWRADNMGETTLLAGTRLVC